MKVVIIKLAIVKLAVVKLVLKNLTMYYFTEIHIIFLKYLNNVFKKINISSNYFK